MARNYQKEYKKEKESKVMKVVKLDIELAKQLDEKLKKDNINFSKFIKSQINDYLNIK